MGGLAVNDTPTSSLADTSESQRYLRLLEGGSLTSVRLGQGAAASKRTAGRLFNKLKDKRTESREVAEIRRAIESGEVKDMR